MKAFFSKKTVKKRRCESPPTSPKEKLPKAQRKLVESELNPWANEGFFNSSKSSHLFATNFMTHKDKGIEEEKDLFNKDNILLNEVDNLFEIDVLNDDSNPFDFHLTEPLKLNSLFDEMPDDLKPLKEILIEFNELGVAGFEKANEGDLLINCLLEDEFKEKIACRHISAFIPYLLKNGHVKSIKEAFLMLGNILYKLKFSEPMNTDEKKLAQYFNSNFFDIGSLQSEANYYFSLKNENEFSFDKILIKLMETMPPNYGESFNILSIDHQMILTIERMNNGTFCLLFLDPNFLADSTDPKGFLTPLKMEFSLSAFQKNHETILNPLMTKLFDAFGSTSEGVLLSFNPKLKKTTYNIDALSVTELSNIVFFSLRLNDLQNTFSAHYGKILDKSALSYSINLLLEKMKLSCGEEQFKILNEFLKERKNQFHIGSLSYTLYFFLDSKTQNIILTTIKKQLETKPISIAMSELLSKFILTTSIGTFSSEEIAQIFPSSENN